MASYCSGVHNKHRFDSLTKGKKPFVKELLYQVGKGHYFYFFLHGNHQN